MKAFPSGHDPKTGTMQHGMTLRDYFAAKALQGLVANNQYFDDVGGTDSEKTARLAYFHADAMLKAREQ